MSSVRVSSAAHRLRLVAEDRDDVAVEGEARVRHDGTRTTIDEAQSRLTVRVPLGTDVVLGATSGRVDVEGAVGAAGVVTESGRIEIERAASLDARTMSGRVQVGRVDGWCRVRNGSGRVEIGGCDGADVATKSGRIVLTHVTDAVTAHCISGRIDVGFDEPADVDAETVSGRISIRLPSTARAHRIDGRRSTPVPEGTNCVVRAFSVSGRVEVTSS